MPQLTAHAKIVLTTASNPDEARTLVRTLVEEGLAACASIVPVIESVYRWEGRIESGNETLLLLKTGADQLADLEQRLHDLHSYQIPEFLVLPVESGSAAYLQWLAESLHSV